MAGKFPIVGIGASAGGIEALEALFRAVPADCPLPFIVIMHLASGVESQLSEILSRAARIPVQTATDGTRVEPGNVYVRPPDSILTIERGRLRLAKPPMTGRPERLIDTFLISLGEDQDEMAIGVLLSGSGSDGAAGLATIQRRGGLTLAQGPNGAGPRFSEMPMAAREMGVVDLVLPASEIPEKIMGVVQSWKAPVSAPHVDTVNAIYDLLRSRTGHDFSGYKDRTFLRRVHRRMQVRQIRDVKDYLEFLQKDAQEVTALFRDLLIGVTEFFRDVPAFAALEKAVIPKLFEGKGAGDDLRVWVPACASGEEAYSIAILLREFMSTLPAAPRVQVFATDIDESALNTARNALYPAAALRQLPEDRRERFFVKESEGFRVSRDVRDMCLFSSHSLIKDPPFSRLDLVSCRNVLIYFSTELQAQVIPVFHYALRPGGYLFLGASENLSRHAELFSVIDKKHRIFRRRDLVPGPLPVLPHFAPQGPPAMLGAITKRPTPVPARERLLRLAAATVLERFSPAHVIVDDTGGIIEYSAHTGRYLDPPAGPPSSNLVGMVRRELTANLRALLRMAIESQKVCASERLLMRVNGNEYGVRISIEPLNEGGTSFYLVVFTDLGPVPASGQPLVTPGSAEDSAVQQLEAELKDTKERLQSMIEELETANEELRSSNEELLSMNEELQSTNEELQTSKEELQSVNEELQTVNTQLNHKIEEVDNANADLKNVFEGTQIATIFLDQDLVIRNFTPAVTAIFNLIPTDRGRPITDIVHRLGHDNLAGQIRTVLKDGNIIEERVTATSGEPCYLMRILPYRAADNKIAGVLMTFTDITSLVQSEARQEHLTEELTRRVKANLQRIAFFSDATLKQAASFDDFRSTFGLWLRALDLLHDPLLRAEWREVSLSKVMQTVLVPFAAAEAKRVSLSGPEMRLQPLATQSMGLALYGLVSGAIRFGALSVGSGTASLSWQIKGRGAKQAVELVWSENGGPPGELHEAERTAQANLILRPLIEELHGTVALAFPKTGMRCTIDLPFDPQLMSLPPPVAEAADT